MAASYDDAVAELYRAPHDVFVAERKRLAGELKAAGDKAGAARLSKLARPTLSAWAVNQLWWQSREPFERLFAAAARLRSGDQGGAGERRDALASLKSRAASLLVEAGHAVSEGTLRRVTTTLSALAASGGFEPDPPGALASDRDPPGFDVAALASSGAAGLGAPGAAGSAASTSSASPSPSTAAATASSATAIRAPEARAPLRDGSGAARSEPSETPTGRGQVDADTAERERAQAERERAERQGAERERLERERLEHEEREREERELAERLRAEERRREVERSTRRAERAQLLASLPALRSDLERREREVERLRAEVARVEALAQQARTAIEAAEKRLADLPEDPS
jgi:hypothetical protein